MKAVVVYESLWGNTAAVARAIAEGIGDGTPALTTSEAVGDVMSEVELLVIGAPVLGFSLPTDQMRSNLSARPGKAPTPPDLDHPSLRAWMQGLAPRRGKSAAFETRLWWSPGSATKAIERGLQKAGYAGVAKRERFIVTGTYGPLREGELDRARRWGAELARAAEGPGDGS